ncbi:LytTR family transcriptional regulator DNA-binding domain-containing protein [Chitinibacter fontanus]|uniref:chitinase n=1 Tax=Chitinibacter fontanus TaxID=1737446 RepID=A0A7D5ZCX2_9NEIS|nr:glycosyl hydrolase family 18 protein [Chitinibacter fontanus]QLI80884.1 LytTR family transcriptional regulator DNA-binding domain-containing protein [Chitinibacter fontanus]
MRKVLILCAFFSLLALPVQAAKRVFAYYPFWVSYSQTKAMADLPLSRLDQLTYSFAVFDAQGQLQAGDAFADLNKPYTQADGTLLRGNYALLKSLKPHYPQLKTVLAVGGWNYSTHFSSVLADPVLRRTAVQSTLQFLQRHGFDGIEVDWRYPGGGGRDGNSAGPQDGENLLRFVAELRAAQPKLIIGVSAGMQPAQLEQVPWQKLAAQCDYVMLLATDLVGAWSPKTSHKSPLYMPEGKLSIDLAVDTLLGMGLPAKQLAVMIPSQGVSFNGVKAQNNGFGQPHGGVSMGSWDNAQTGPTGVFGQDEIAALKQGQGFVEYWDEVAQANYFYSPTRQQFISIETPRALAAKLAYVNQRDLLGLGLWEITSDASANSLLRQIEREIHPIRALQHDVDLWWQHHPAWVELALGALLALLLLLGVGSVVVAHRRRQQEQLQWLNVRQVKDLVEDLPVQLAQLMHLKQAAPAVFDTRWHDLHEASDRIAWQFNVLQPRAVELRVVEPPASFSAPADPQLAAPRVSPAPDISRVVAFSQFSQRLAEQRSLEKMLEVTMQFLANDPLVHATELLQLDEQLSASESHSAPPDYPAQQLNTELDDYQLKIQFHSQLTEADRSYFQSVLDQLHRVRHSLYELGRQPQLLSELYEIASRRDKLQFIRAEKGYSAIVAQDLRAPSYITLRLRAIRLYFDDSLLIQVHRSYLINPKKVRAAQKRGREGWCVLIADEVIPIARQYLPRIRQDFPHWFVQYDSVELARS